MARAARLHGDYVVVAGHREEGGVLIPAVQVMDKDLNVVVEAAILKLGYSIDFSRKVVAENGRVYVAGMIHLDPQGAPSVIPVLYIVALREAGAPKAVTVTQTVLQTVTARETVTMTTLETVTVERIVEREKTVTAYKLETVTQRETVTLEQRVTVEETVTVEEKVKLRDIAIGFIAGLAIAAFIAVILARR